MQNSQTIPKHPAMIGPTYLNPVAMAGGGVDPPAGMQGLALSLVILSVVLLSYSGGSSAETVAFGSQIAVALLAVMIIVGRIFVSAPFRFPLEFKLMFVFTVWLFVITFVHPGGAFERALSIELYTPVAKSVVAAIVVINAVTGRRAYKMVLVSVVLAVILAALGGLTGAFRGGQEGAETYGRYVGTFGNANGMGNICTYAIWALVVLYFGTKAKFRKFVMICIGLLVLAILSSTGSRQSMLCVVIVGAATYWFVMRRTVKSVPLKVGLLVGVCLGFTGYMVYLSTTPHWIRILDMFGITHGGAAQSDTARASFLKTSFQAFLENPATGIGLGNLRLMLRGGTAVQHLGGSPHNTIGALGAYGGLPAWLLFYGALVVAVRRLHRVSKMPIPDADRRMVLAGWGIFLAMIVWSFTDEMIFAKHFWLLLALNVGYMQWLETTYGHAAPLPMRYAPATPMRRPPATQPGGGGV